MKGTSKMAMLSLSVTSWMTERSIRVVTKRPLYLLLLVGLTVGCTAGQSLGVPVDDNRTPAEKAPINQPPALPPTTTVPAANLSEATRGMPGEEWEEIEEGIRSRVVKIFTERGMSSEMAEAEADRRMAEGVEVGVVEEEFEIFEDWMRNYPDHPVLGSHWTEDDAQCVIFTMLKRVGIRETGKLLTRTSRGGMSGSDAKSLVQPVADCVSLKEMVQADMRQNPAVSVEGAECVIGDLTEEQVVSWFVADFTDGARAMRNAFLRDVDWSCWPADKPPT